MCFQSRFAKKRSPQLQLRRDPPVHTNLSTLSYSVTQGEPLTGREGGGVDALVHSSAELGTAAAPDLRHIMELPSLPLSPPPLPSSLLLDAGLVMACAGVVCLAAYFQGRLLLIERADATWHKLLAHIHIDEAPEYVRCMKGLVRGGYRSPELGWGGALRSAFTLHNETWNAWTMLYGGVMSSFLYYYASTHVVRQRMMMMMQQQQRYHPITPLQPSRSTSSPHP